MSYFNRLVVLALFGFVLMALCATANAQTAPVLGLVPFGNSGNGITEQTTWTSGVGEAATTDSYANGFMGQNVAQGFGGCGWPGFGCGLGSCGFPGGFSSWGPYQTGAGGNFGAQNSAASGYSTATSFGLQPTGLVFGIPVAGPSGLVYT